VYYRVDPGQGIFAAVFTEYNWVTHQLQAPFSGFGEYILGFPDVAEVMYPPLLITPLNGAEVNQTLPVSFFWTPKGFAGSYDFQVSSTSNFTTLLVNQTFLTESRYTNVTVAAGTPYYWRVRTWNYEASEAGDWSTNSFTSVPPTVRVTVPNGGEAWRRGLSYYVQWNANVTENIALDLYKGGGLVRTIVTNAPGNLAYNWTFPTSLVPGSDYSIRIRSTANASLYDESDAPFSIIDAPVFNAGAVTRLANGQVQIVVTVPGAALATVLGSTNLSASAWQELKTVPLTSGSAVFTDDTATNYPARFYRIRVP